MFNAQYSCGDVSIDCETNAIHISYIICISCTGLSHFLHHFISSIGAGWILLFNAAGRSVLLFDAAGRWVLLFDAPGFLLVQLGRGVCDRLVGCTDAG